MHFLASEKVISREPEDTADANMSLRVQLSLDHLELLFSSLSEVNSLHWQSKIDITAIQHDSYHLP